MVKLKLEQTNFESLLPMIKHTRTYTHPQWVIHNTFVIFQLLKTPTVQHSSPLLFLLLVEHFYKGIGRCANDRQTPLPSHWATCTNTRPNPLSFTLNWSNRQSKALP